MFGHDCARQQRHYTPLTIDHGQKPVCLQGLFTYARHAVELRTLDVRRHNKALPTAIAALGGYDIFFAFDR
jgi:hypothetical protein